MITDKTKIIGDKFYVHMDIEFGKGAFASVVRSTNKDDPTTVIACKVVDKRKLSKVLDEHLNTEIKILQQIHHKNIIKLESAMATPATQIEYVEW